MTNWDAHDGAVYDLVFTPNGRHLLTSARDGVQFWSWMDSKQLREWPGGPRCPIAICPEGEFFGRGGDYGIEVFPLSGGDAVLNLHATSPSVAFSPDGEMFVANAVSEGFLRRWAMPTGIELAGEWGEMTSESYPHGPLAFHPDGSLLATAFLTAFDLSRRYESVVTLWDAKRGRDLGRLRPTTPTGRITRMAFSPDGRLLAGIYGPTMIVWDLASRTELARRQPSSKHFKGIAFTPSGKHLLTASSDTYLQIWFAPDWQPTPDRDWKIGKLGCVAVSADGTVAAAGGSTGKVVVWDLE